MFNREAFLEDVKRIHLNPDDTLPDIDVREELDSFIDYDKLLVSKALDDICNNVVGNTMFMLLMMNLPPGMRLRIIDIGPEQARTGDPLVKQEGSSYEDYDVRINLNVYNKDGIGIPERQYYCVDKGGNITLKLKSLASSIFHEFVHCLHHIEDAVRYDRDCYSPVPKPWDDEEECRTISGYTDPGIYDPICDNCFDLYESMDRPIPHPPPKPRSITYRLIMAKPPSHKVTTKAIPYRPRLGHIGYVRGSEYSYEDLLQYRRCLNFDLAWPRKYI